jgi:hypothetical protein
VVFQAAYQCQSVSLGMSVASLLSSQMILGLWADPHGAYAILALLVLGILGAAIAPGGLRDKPRRTTRIIAAALLLGAALSLLWPQFVTRPVLDVNPAMPAVAQLAGTWNDGPDTLQLRTDGTYSCRGVRCTGFGAQGTWTRDAGGSLVARTNDGHSVPWRVVMYRGRYRLALMPSGTSGATWEGRLTFEKAAP